MQNLIATLRIKRLKLAASSYGLLFTITHNRRFFDKKIKVGILMLSLLSLLASCSTPSTSKSNMEKADQPKDSARKKLDSNISKGAGKAVKKEAAKEPEVMCYYSTAEEEMPLFPGGHDSLMQFIRKNLSYPAAAKEKGIQGTVYLQFTIDTLGDVKDSKVVRGVTPELDAEALRIIGLMPRWKPGLQWGQKVRVGFTLPIQFSLNEATRKDTTQTPQL